MKTDERKKNICGCGDRWNSSRSILNIWRCPTCKKINEKSHFVRLLKGIQDRVDYSIGIYVGYDGEVDCFCFRHGGPCKDFYQSGHLAKTLCCNCSHSHWEADEN